MNELDVVKLVKNFNGIPLGTTGTIVHKYNDENFEVEFFDDEGNTIDVLTMHIDYIELQK